MSVVHKFILSPEVVTAIRLEVGARPLYIDVDSRSSAPALWVLRCAGIDLDLAVERYGADRYFGVVMTGVAFETPVVPRPLMLGPAFMGSGALRSHHRTRAEPLGLGRFRDIIFHGFEFVVPAEGAGTDEPISAVVRWHP